MEPSETEARSMARWAYYGVIDEFMQTILDSQEFDDGEDKDQVDADSRSAD